MTNEELIKKAQELVGSWIYDKTNKDEYLFVYDYYDYYRNGDDVMLGCIAINSKDVISPYIKDTEVWMSEFDEYYRKVSEAKCIKVWEKIKKYYDKMFAGGWKNENTL